MEISEELLIRFLREEVSPAEQHAVEAWYEADTAHQKHLRELYRTESLVRRVYADRHGNTERSLDVFRKRVAFRENKNTKKIFLRRVMRFSVAASLIGVLAGSLWVLPELTRENTFMVRTERGEKTQFTLPDGTKVWLNACSEVKYTTSLFSSERKVSLHGEAYFEVYRNERKPFVVESKNLQTKVLGTKFNIRALDTEQKVVASLKEGCIELTGKNNMQSLRMQPLQQVVFDTNTGEFSMKKMSDPEKCAQWQAGILSFESATLEEITNNLRLYYDIKVDFKEEELRNERFAGNFRVDQSPDQIFTLLSMTKSISYKKEKSVYTFSYIR